MKELFWRVELSDGAVFTGREEVRGGELRIGSDPEAGSVVTIVIPKKRVKQEK